MNRLPYNPKFNGTGMAFEKMWEKVKMILTSFFSRNVSYPSRTFLDIFHRIYFVVCKCFKFEKKSGKLSQNSSLGDMHRTNFKYENKQRAITQKLSKQELRFMCTALPLDEIYLPTKFHYHS